MSFSRPPPGAVFAGDFRIVRALKEGGMGAVYVAEQLSTGALRALKLMHPQYVKDDGMRRRFEQEARVGARIQSDYVVNVIAAGVDDATKAPWIAMELLDGEDLADHVARVGRLPPSEALEILRMFCHAIAAAHDAGIVHRDLKPENVYLAKSRRPGEAFTVKVLDFGIARATADVRATGTAALGTPLWMAPEQTSRGPNITPATDVWAIGLIAYYLLTGSWYWRTAHLDSPSITEFLRELTLEPLDPATIRAADLGHGPLPDGFDTWFARCVAREPPARFQDARTAFAALAPVLSAAPASANLATGATVPVTAGALAARATAPKRARPYFVGTGTDRALAQSPAVGLPALPVIPPAVTAPATSLSGAVPERAAAPRSRVWPVVVLLGIGVGGGGAWLWTTRHPVPGSASATAVPEDVARAAGQDVARESPMVSFAGAVFPLGFDAGAIDEKPVHDVSFPTFFLQIDEVTVVQYARCVTAGKCTPAGTEEFCNAGRDGRDLNPINCVSQPQAATYCAWLGRRLPTEDEWEYAASGRAKRLYAWGNTSPSGRACLGRPEDGTCAVATFDAGSTPEGVRDMTGNVWEWTSSDYCMYDTTVACGHDQKVARGGGWFSADPNVVRTQVRQGYAPLTRSANVGFRCAKAL
ncbi:MAG TPA: SUMF1/EgtB/PvdO family nonheme iron enzyme [Polyangiaceae bacterium]|jgi:formylglycine-generating enzyme required for sulfatase activity